VMYPSRTRSTHRSIPLASGHSPLHDRLLATSCTCVQLHSDLFATLSSCAQITTTTTTITTTSQVMKSTGTVYKLYDSALSNKNFQVFELDYVLATLRRQDGFLFLRFQ
jgi:hypothetical protein